MKLLKKTRSICPTCLREINADIFEDNGKIYMEKTCPEHGEATVLLERDSWFYKKILDTPKPKRKRFQTLTVTLTHKCNNNCSFCYLPQRDDFEMSTEELKRQIAKFPGKLIRLSGGEPTLRKDLPEIIKFASRRGKKTSLLTNGITLSDYKYVKTLEHAGLNFVHLSINSLNPETLQRMEGGTFDAKMKALHNLAKTKIKITPSFMIIKGQNEHEIKRIIKFSIRNPNVIDIRIRSAVHIGRHSNEKRTFLSELFYAASKSLGIDEERLFVEREIFRMASSFIRTSPTVHTCSFAIALIRKGRKAEFFSDGIDTKRFQTTTSKTIFLISHILKRRKVVAMKTVLGSLLGKGNNHIIYLNLRSWPDKYTMDLNNIDCCRTAQLTQDKNAIPFCYALVMNERDKNI